MTENKDWLEDYRRAQEKAALKRINASINKSVGSAKKSLARWRHEALCDIDALYWSAMIETGHTGRRAFVPKMVVQVYHDTPKLRALVEATKESNGIAQAEVFKAHWPELFRD